MRVRLNKAHYPVTALGYGTRIGIWFQGCSIGCRGCLSLDTWPSSPEDEVEIDEVMAWSRDVAGGRVDGVTFSGGEPFEQPEALQALAEAFRGWRHESSAAFDLLCYSGIPYQRLRRDHGELIQLFDALIPEPFVMSKPDGAIWRGSDNQPLLRLSPLGEKRYGPFADHHPQRPPIQLTVTDQEIWYVGVPRRGDLQRLEEASAIAGLRHTGPSWRP